MPAPEELIPQVPGEQPASALPAEGELHPTEALEALAAANADQVTAALPDMDDAALEALAVIESETRNRVTVLRAISAELAARHPEDASEAEAPASTPLPAKFDRAVLTDKGWLVPEPHQRTTKV